MFKTRTNFTDLLFYKQVTEQQGGSTNDFQEAYINDGKRAQKGRHSMDRALEDKISDLYDLYVEVKDSLRIDNDSVA